MNTDELRAKQAPLKQQYRDNPASALIPAHAAGTLSLDDIACTVHSWHGDTTAGLHKAGGGSGELACSADMLLEAMVACAGVTLRAVATAMGVTIRSGKIVADGVWDARGTLAIDRAAPVGLTEVTLRFDIDSDADQAKLERMIQTTERYCVILQTLKTPPKLSVVIGAG
ncbi:MAG: OsmC family peroxiredoxin [Acetobacteraceae bacterium]|nr:OsmC family peroxiredoxin [Acetobacteraceae bacterium]